MRISDGLGALLGRRPARTKVFGIGLNKTGTTSLAFAFRGLGYRVGHQGKAERLLRPYLRADFRRIVRYCRSADFFQDVPFSLRGTYRYMDEAFPGSKFILTVRHSPEEWVASVVGYHARLFGHGAVPSAKDLMAARYVWPGWIWEVMKVWGVSEAEPYNKERLIRMYLDHNEEVQAYFKGRGDLLVLEIAKESAYETFCNFLGVHRDRADFPWKNKTSDIEQLP